MEIVESDDSLEYPKAIHLGHKRLLSANERSQRKTDPKEGHYSSQTLKLPCQSAYRTSIYLLDLCNKTNPQSQNLQTEDIAEHP